MPTFNEEPAVYVMDIREIDGKLESVLPLLPEYRKKKIEKFKPPAEKLRCAAAGLLLKQVTGIDEDRDITFNEYGKPMLKEDRPGEPFCFSLSHGGFYASLSVATGRTGCDVEDIDTYTESIVRRCFSDAERKWVNEQPVPERFFAVWTMKESIMKMDGRGFNMDPRSFSVFDPEWKAKYTIYDGHVFACAPCSEQELIIERVAPALDKYL